MSQCPYENIYQHKERDGVHMRFKACGKPVEASGWCSEHGYVYELLQAACEASYPDFVIATINNQPCYTVSRGRLNWEGYAKRHQTGRHSDLMKRLRAMIEMEKAA